MRDAHSLKKKFKERKKRKEKVWATRHDLGECQK